MQEMTVDTLIAKIKDKDDKVRAAAWQAAGKVGAPAIKPLAAVVKDGELEIARSAKRALWQIVRHAGRPGAEAERKAVLEPLGDVVGDDQMPLQLRREAIWMLSEISKDEEVEPDVVAPALQHPDLREDIRCALQRVSGPNCIATLRKGYEASSGDFKAALACSLRACGVEVADPPCPKLKPTKQTAVKPVGQ